MSFNIFVHLKILLAMYFKQHFATILFLFVYGNSLVLPINTSEDFAFKDFTSATVLCHPAEFFAELQTPSDSDKIILKNGKEMVCEVKKVSDKFVFYTKPNTDTPDWIDRSEVHSIRYSNGEVVELSNYTPEKEEGKDWRSIKLTKISEDIVGLTKIDNIDVRFEARDRKTYKSAIALERGAEIVIMKQAATMNADIVFVTNINHIRAYGDPPVIIMNCQAYRKP